MTYAATVAADSPILWYRLVESGGYSRNFGSDPANLYAFGSLPTVGFTGIASDGGAVALLGGATMAAYPTTIITAASGYSLEGWIYVMGETPFNAATADYPLQLFIDSANGFQLGMVPSTQLATVRDPSHTSNGISATVAAAFGWHHLCATRAAGATTGIQLYIDGTSVGTSTAYTNFGVDEPVRFNLISTPTPVSLFVAEPAVYYSELSSGRVAAHASGFDTLASPRYINRLGSSCT